MTPHAHKPAGKRIRVLVVDDHPAVRSGLASVLGHEADITVVAEAGSAREAVAAWRHSRPDVGLVDLLMPVHDGVETLGLIREVDPQARVLMLSASERATDAARAEHAGACGYVTKEATPLEIARAIREVHGGATRVRSGHLRGPAKAEEVVLTPREQQVLELLRRGASNLEIAVALVIAEPTVKTHVKSLMEKLHTGDRAGVVGRAFDLGLLKAEL